MAGSWRTLRYQIGMPSERRMIGTAATSTSRAWQLPLELIGDGYWGRLADGRAELQTVRRRRGDARADRGREVEEQPWGSGRRECSRRHYKLLQ